jgi:hypothetical protein
MDFGKIDDRLFGGGMYKFLRLIMILSILVAELKLRVSLLLQHSFRRIEFRERLCTMLTAIIATLIDRDLFPVFPAEESMIAVGTEVF